jgi:hypothetical protein
MNKKIKKNNFYIDDKTLYNTMIDYNSEVLDISTVMPFYIRVEENARVDCRSVFIFYNFISKKLYGDYNLSDYMSSNIFLPYQEKEYAIAIESIANISNLRYINIDGAYYFKDLSFFFYRWVIKKYLKC